MPVERWTPERRRELTRTTLIAAAAEVFARRGFEGASLEEIAETAGFTRGAIYKTFGSKEELFFAVSDDDFAARLQSFADKIGESAELAEPGELAAMWRESVVGDRADLALNMEVRLYAMRNPEVTARFAEHQRTTRRALAQFIVDTAARMGLTLTVPAIDPRRRPRSRVVGHLRVGRGRSRRRGPARRLLRDLRPRILRPR